MEEGETEEKVDDALFWGKGGCGRMKPLYWKRYRV